MTWLLWLNTDALPLAESLQQAARHYRRTRGEAPNVAQVNAREEGNVDGCGLVVEWVTSTPVRQYRVGRNDDA